jgi:hypothetical protein
VPRLWEVYPGICLTTEEKSRENLSQVSRRMSVGKEYTNLYTIFTNFLKPISYKIMKVIKIIVKINLEVRLEVLTTMTVKIFFGDVRDIRTLTFQRDLLLP